MVNAKANPTVFRPFSDNKAKFISLIMFLILMG
jgi:hypothetical protein